VRKSGLRENSGTSQSTLKPCDKQFLPAVQGDTAVVPAGRVEKALDVAGVCNLRTWRATRNGACRGINSPLAWERRRSQVSHSPSKHCALRQSNSQSARSSGTSRIHWSLSHCQTRAKMPNFFGRAYVISHPERGTTAVGDSNPRHSNWTELLLLGNG